VSSDRYTWYNSLKHGGMLVAPSRLASADCFPDELSPLPGYLAERLRRDLVRLETGGASGEAVPRAGVPATQSVSDAWASASITGHGGVSIVMKTLDILPLSV
jgi:hypothetical protein